MPYKDKAKGIAYKTKWNKDYYKNNINKERLRVKSRKLELKAWFKKYKSTLNCVKCGESHIACIEFHHKDRANKNFELSESILKRGYSKKRVLEEMDKCIVLCANCHRKLHSERETG